MRLRPRNRITTIQRTQRFEIAYPVANLVFRHPKPVHEPHTEVAIGRRQGVVDPRPFATTRDKAGVFQRGQVPRDFGLAHSKYIHDLTDAGFTLPQQIQDAKPGVVGQGFEDYSCSRHRCYPLSADVGTVTYLFLFIGSFSDTLQCHQRFRHGRQQGNRLDRTLRRQRRRLHARSMASPPRFRDSWGRATRSFTRQSRRSLTSLMRVESYIGVNAGSHLEANRAISDDTRIK